MKETTFNKKQLIKYLIWTFGIAYLMQAAIGVLAWNGLALAAQPMMAVMMFVPLLGVLLSGFKLRNIGWKPRFKGNMKYILIAWFAPLLLTAVGAALYFLVFPSHFDISGKALASLGTEEAAAQLEAQLEAQGISYPLYCLITVIASVTYAPAVNMLLAAGEEAGWRGFLYPQLKARFGKRAAWLIGGAIWGMWHWPVIWLIGYEYGSDYFGFPVVGMLEFCIITVALGIISDWLYEKSGCIWLSALFHGSINAAATLPMLVTVTDAGSARLLGSAPVGLLAGLPFILLAAVLLVKAEKKAENLQNNFR